VLHASIWMEEKRKSVQTAWPRPVQGTIVQWVQVVLGVQYCTRSEFSATVLAQNILYEMRYVRTGTNVHFVVPHTIYLYDTNPVHVPGSIPGTIVLEYPHKSSATTVYSRVHSKLLQVR
jgi:hypothetical protein